MTNNNIILINQLYENLRSSLELDLFSNGIFYGERLLCEADNEEVRYLLAKCYQGEGKYNKSYEILKACNSHKCRFLLAQICIKLNKLIEAEKAIYGEKGLNFSISDRNLENEIVFGSAGYYLLGIICEKLAKNKDAFSAFTKSLELDPFMWCSFEKICKLNPVSVDAKQIYSDMNPKIAKFLVKFNNIHDRDFSLSPEISNNQKIVFQQYNYTENNVDKVNNNPFIQYTSEKNIKNNEKSNNLQKGIQQIQEDLPESFNNPCFNLNFSKRNAYNSNSNNSNNKFNFNTNMTPVVSKEKNELDFNQPPNVKLNNVKNFLSGASSSISPNILDFNNNFVLGSHEQSNFDLKHKLIDTSLIKPFTINSNSVLSGEMTPNLQKVIGSSNRQEREGYINNTFIQNDPSNLAGNINKNIFSNIQISGKGLNTSITNNKPNSNNSSLCNFKEYANNQFKSNSNSNLTFSDISHLLKVFAEILISFHLFNCKEAIEIIKSLPKIHYNTGYCLTLLARCYFELSMYKDAEKYFQESFKIEPFRLEGLEYYSSCLWHLQDQYKLCHLANEALEQSYFSPETWIIFGNCYSLQKEHEVALKFFNRAIQLNPSFSYAYTLSAHEYTETEAFSQAKNFYKDAIGYDERHYNAWWGLGNIYSKEQNYTEAIKYFKRAVQINPNSAILYNYLALAHQNNKQLKHALQQFELSEKIDNNNPMTKYQKANVLVGLKQYEQALKMLLEMTDKLPKEAPIHILIGKIYKLQKNYHKALAHFNLALDIDPKDSNIAKSLIEKIYADESIKSEF